MHSSAIPLFSPHLFWDIDSRQMDWITKADAVLTRVLNRRSIEDVIEAKRFYGMDSIQKLLSHANTLSPEGYHLAKLLCSIA